MKLLSKIWFPVAVSAALAGASLNPSREPVERSVAYFAPDPSKDTIVYPANGYKLRRHTTLDELKIVDSLSGQFSEDSLSIQDTVKRISPRDSLKALLDTSLWSKIDSIYIADSTAKAKAAHEAWYASLSPKERRAYDAEQKGIRKVAEADSLRKVKEEKQNLRDSLLEVKPRILETYALTDSMQYKRIIAWKADQDFMRIEAFRPDTSYNYHYYDYPFQRNDVNASWLGVAGSAVQYYDVRKRTSDENVEFYKALEAWSVSPRTTLQYNSKTPYTELAYYGTLLAGDAKESDNLHIFTTQNITPELNFNLLYDRFGGKGILDKEETINKTFVGQVNYLGKKYTLQTGYIYNMVSRQENGGIVDNSWIRDTTVDGRDITVALQNAKSKIKKNSFYLDQQLRIPFNFINRIKASKDTSFVFNADSLQRDITTAFVGHSSEFSTYTRKYTDQISDDYGRNLYNNIFNYNPVSSADSMRVSALDNKVYIRLQPWSSEAIVSKLDVGVGDVLRTYFDSTSVRPNRHVENTFYAYAGAEGQLRSSLFWNAKARLSLIGFEAGDFKVEANARLNLYPFRRARKSPLTLSAHFETSLQEPNWYQQHINANHYSWDNDFSKISNTLISGEIDIPRWKINANVGYTLLANNIYYDSKGIIQQNAKAMSVLTASLRKEFVLGPLHLDNKALLQFSSNQEVVPVPTLALNLRYYLQFVVQRDDLRRNVMVMQIGANGYYNTKWYSPAWNPNLGVFFNQRENQYNNGPYLDLFVNVQWKRACIFIKYQNFGNGWPMKKADYFSADHYIVTKSGIEGLKLGVYWPFYTQPAGR